MKKIKTLIVILSIIFLFVFAAESSTDLQIYEVFIYNRIKKFIDDLSNQILEES